MVNRKIRTHDPKQAKLLRDQSVRLSQGQQKEVRHLRRMYDLRQRMIANGTLKPVGD